MKTLTQTLNESLILESDSSFGKIQKRGNKVVLSNPGLIWNKNYNGDGDWVYQKPYELEVPNAKFYLFNDRYHKCPHIVTLRDIAMMLTTVHNSRGMLDFDDYEAYSPKDVIMSANSLGELLNKMLRAGYIKKDGEYYETLKNLFDSEEFIEDAFDNPKRSEKYLLQDEAEDMDKSYMEFGDGLFDESGKLYWASSTLYDCLLKAGFGNVLKANNKANLNKVTIKDLTRAGFFKK